MGCTSSKSGKPDDQFFLLRQEFAHVTDTKQIQRLQFLYSKGVLANAVPGERIAKFSTLLNPPPGTSYVKALNRLDKLLNPIGDAHGGVVPSDVQTFDDAMTSMPQWTAADTFIHQSVKQFPVQRVQRSGLCYIHAPEVVQHYLVSMHTQTDAGMINMAEMIRDTWDGEQLTHHIFDNKGGNSHTMLKHILQPNSIVFAGQSELYLKNLQLYGPGLVTTFAVHDGFASNATQNSFDGAVDAQTYKGHHAMVLIGVRTDTNGCRWFLLQNWWPKMQFVEVSETYLKSSGATVYFVETPQSAIPIEFPQYTARYAENENLDKEETYEMLED